MSSTSTMDERITNLINEVDAIIQRKINDGSMSEDCACEFRDTLNRARTDNQYLFAITMIEGYLLSNDSALNAFSNSNGNATSDDAANPDSANPDV